MRSEETVGSIGEAEMLRRILAELDSATTAPVGPGDDCAVLKVRGELVVTSDTMIEGPDFRLAWHSGFELGWKLAATNLSDVAAMGAVPTGLTVSLAFPAETSPELLVQLAAGLTAACRELAPGCAVVGGDLGRAPVLMAAVTALGEMRELAPVLRSGASAGDVVAYAGQLGLAGTGLSVLFAEASDDGVAHAREFSALRERHGVVIGAQLAPRPPISLGERAAAAGATAMLDVSDGLALDAARLARASSVAVDLDSELLLAAFGEQQQVQVPLEAMLFGGEDHGLLATFPAETELPIGFMAIGVARDRDQAGVISGVNKSGFSHALSSILLVDGTHCEPKGWDPYLIPASYGVV